jgi:hypothetical protein
MNAKKTLADRVREKLRGRPVPNGAGTAPPVARGTGDKTDKTERKSAATRLVELVEGAGVELFHTTEHTAFACIPIDTHREVLPIRGTAFRRWLSRVYYQQDGRAAGGQAVQDAINILEGKACHGGPECAVSVRIAEHDGRIYLDLADTDWRVVEIDAAGWRVVEAAPVRFRRPKGLWPLSAPVPGGTIDDLRPFVNVADEGAFRLLVAWLVQALRPRGPYPLLCLHGQQGSAKSTAARVVRALIDPSASPLRSEPREPRDLMIAATNSWCVSWDNLSSLPPWLSDALCRLATGGGFATRELYSNDEEAIFDAMRPVVLNGIEDVATRGDLLERAVLLSLPPIPDDRRRTEREFKAAFEAARPRILGALLTAVAGALRDLPNVQLASLPRMADFVEWATAAERSLGWPHGSFVTTYSDNRSEANEVALEASPLVPFVRRFVEANPTWTGTASDLLHQLKAVAGEAAGKSKEWPGNAKVLSGRLKRLAPNLRDVGIIVEWGRAEDKVRTRTIRLTRSDRVGNGASGASGVSKVLEFPKETGPGSDASGRKAAPSDAPPDAPMGEKTAALDAPDAPDARKRSPSELRPGDDGYTPF